MKTKTKIILVFCIFALLILASLCGTILYYYSHPSAIKSLMEKSISGSTGTSFTIKSLSYSISPLRIRAKGILFKPGEDLRGFHLKIPEFIADMALEGAFGNRTLTFKNLRIERFSFNISRDLDLTGIMPKPGSPSFLGRTAKRLIALLLFRDIRFQGAQIANGSIVAQTNDFSVKIGGIHAHMDSDHLIEILCKTEFQWPSQKIHFTAPHLLITTDRAISIVDPEIRCLLTAKKATLQGPEANVESVGVTAKLRYHHEHKRLTFEPLELFLEQAVLKQESGNSPPLELRLKTQGFFDLRTNELNAPHFHLSINDVLELEGKANARLGPETDVGLELFNGRLFPQKALNLVPAGLKAQFKPITLSGPVHFHGMINALKVNGEWDWHYDFKAGLKENRFCYAAGETKVNARITGDIRAKGKLPGTDIQLSLRSDRIAFSGKGVEIRPFTMGLSISGRYPVFEIEELTANVPQAKVAAREKEIAIDDIKVNIQKGTFNAKMGSLLLPEIRVDSSWLKNLLLSLKLDDEEAVVEVRGKDIHLIQPGLGLNLLPAGWQYKGLESIHIRAVQKEKGDWLFTSKLNVQGSDFQDRDSKCMGENISIATEINGKIDLEKSCISVNASLNVHKGEILYDRFYFDLNSNPFSSSCKGMYDFSGKLLQFSGLRLGLKDILNIKMHGSILQKAGDLCTDITITIPETPLKSVFSHLILEPFQTEKPFLSLMNIGGGFSAALKLTGAVSHPEVIGHCLWHNGELSSTNNGFSVQGIDIDLPVWYQTRKSTKDRKAIKGRLSIQSIMLPRLPKQPLTIRLDAGPNRLSVLSPTVLRIPGGNLQVGSIIGRGIFGPQPSIETSLTIKAVDINPLLSGIWPHPIQGTINGKLDHVHFEGGTLSTHGKIRAELFDGEVILSNLGASGMFSSTPVFKLNARWNGLRLTKMTTGTSFGQIEGILEGHIKDLEIAYGQPQRFDLLLETIKKKGVPQKISVTAVDNIARIGGGESPFMGLAGAFSSLFKKFPYKKIGVHASLENDIFRINGTIREGGKEYLVKRGGLSGVNIVNQNPDNRISLKDMIKRIKRITAGRGGPVIN